MTQGKLNEPIFQSGYEPVSVELFASVRAPPRSHDFACGVAHRSDPKHDLGKCLSLTSRASQTCIGFFNYPGAFTIQHAENGQTKRQVRLNFPRDSHREHRVGSE